MAKKAAEPTLLPPEPAAPAPEAKKAEPGKVTLNVKTNTDQMVEVEPPEPEAPETPEQEPPATESAQTPPEPTPAPGKKEPEKPDPLKPWRMADGKLDEAKVAKDREEITPWIMAGQEAIDLYKADPEFKKAYLAAQKRKGIQLKPEDEALLTPPKPARTQADVQREYLALHKKATQAKGDEAVLLMQQAEDLWMDWRLEQKFGPKIAEAERIANETKAKNEREAQERIQREANDQIRKEYEQAAKKYDGIVAIDAETKEPVWLDKAVADVFIPLAAKYPQESVDELMGWTLAKLGRLQVEPEPEPAPRPRIRGTTAVPVSDKKKKEEEARKNGQVTLKVSKQVDVLDEE